MKASRTFVLALPFLASLLCVAGERAQRQEARQAREDSSDRGKSFVRAEPEVPQVGEEAGFSLPAETPVRLVKFSGAVKDADGKPRTGITGIIFALYKDQAGGAALWLETQNVTLDAQGRYTVLLGANSAEGLPVDVFSANEAQWLGVQPEGQAEQRVLLVSVPYALKAADAETLGGMPASSFVLAAPVATGGSGNSGSQTAGRGANYVNSGAVANTITGTANYLPVFTSNAGDMGNSVLYQQATTNYLGIGTANPQYNFQLVVPGEDWLWSGFALVPAFSGGSNWNTLYGNGGSGFSLIGTAKNKGYPNSRLDMGGNATINFQTGDGTAAPTSKLFVTAAGNVGIGTTTPGSQLEVAGHVKVSGAGNAVIFPDGTMRTSAISINGTLSVSGPVQITAPGKGITVRSPDGGACEQIGIDNTGKIYTPNVSCPYPLAILTTSLHSATVGTAYDQPIQTSGGNGTAITFALANSTTLPAWASLNPATGHITGTPAAGDAGTSAPFQISATQPGNTVTSGNLSILTVAASNCAGAPTGHESMLNGEYAFVAQGFDSGGAYGRPVAIAASFHADGAGNVSGGDFDINNAAGATHATINASSYTVGPDPTSSGNLGCVALSLSNGSTAIFRFSLGGLSSGVFSKGRIIEFDDTTGTGSRGSGVLLRQDTTSISLSHLQPRYAYGVDGVDSSGGRHFASSGSFTVDTSGNISSGFADTNYAGTASGALTGGTGKINAISTTTGRATMSLTLGGQTTHQAIYMVNADEVFMIGTDPLSSVPIYSGRAIVTASSFTQSSLSGNYVIHATGIEPPGNCNWYTFPPPPLFIPCADVVLALVNLDSTSGTYGGTSYYYELSPTVFVPSPVSGATYVVDATSGRTTLSALGWVVGPSVFYIATPTATTEPISAFFVATSDYRADFGFAEFQPSQTYSTGALAGDYFAGTEDPGDYTVTDEIGVVNISSGGAVTGGGYASWEFDLATTSPSGTISIGSNGVGTWHYSLYGCPYNYVAITNGTRLFTMLDGGVYCNGVPVLRPAVVTVYERQ